MQTEQHRHRAEVRDLISKARRNGLGWLKGYVAGWKRWDGSALQADFWRQHKAGNTGAVGEWIEG